MDLSLQGKSALVTGFTVGIGFATALHLAQEGTAVTVNGRIEARVQQAVEQIRVKVPQANLQGVVADVGTAAGCAHIIEVLPETDILANNVGIFEPKAFAGTLTDLLVPQRR